MSEEQTIPGAVVAGAEDQKGWDWFDETVAQVNKAREREDGLTEEDLSRTYAKVFGSKQGQIVLRDIMRFVHMTVSFDPNMGFYNGAAFGYYREGIKQTPIYINRMVEGIRNG